MSFILSWRGFFKRKRRDPRLWAEANNVDSYERCVKLINKMCLREPTLEEYNQEFAPLVEEKASKDVVTPEPEVEKVPVVKSVPPKERATRKASAKASAPKKAPSTKKPAVAKESTSEEVKTSTTTKKRAPRKRSTTTRSRSRKSSTKDAS